MVEHVLAKDETGVRFSYSAQTFLMKQDLTTEKNIGIPSYVTHVTETLKNSHFEAFLVGGCVRDILMSKNPKDWDMTTNASPEQIQGLFEKTVYENSFGTVGICVSRETPNNNVSHETTPHPNPLLKGEGVVQYHIIEVTPYRKEGKYSDNRHPDEVVFTENIEEDLGRRDFTMNAIAFLPSDDKKDGSNLNHQQITVPGHKGHFIDIYDGIKDIKDKIIRAVGNPRDRFQEDALRMLRAVRFSTVLDFSIEGETLLAIAENAHLIATISKERIRDEFVKIIESPRPKEGIDLLQKLGLLKHIIPELEEGIGCHQGGAHIYDVYEHLLGAVQHSADKGFSTNIRLSALFHDIGKPRTKRTPNPKAKPTFYGHEVIGAKMTKKILTELHFSREDIDFITNMVRRHMFFSDTEQITLSAVRRIITSVGKEHIWELMQVRECDRVGMAKAEAPYRLRKYHAMIEECLHDPISVGQLAIDGGYMIRELHMKPGPRMGWILHALLEEVLDDPEKNTIEYLVDSIKRIDTLPDADLHALGEKAKDKKEELEEQEVEKLHKKHGV